MADLELWMIEQKYGTEKVEREERIITAPDFPIRSIQILADSSSERSKTEETLYNTEVKVRKQLINPENIGYAKHNGRIESIYIQEDGSKVTYYGTGFVFARNWVMTVALNVYNPIIDKFADSILYYPALSGNLENPPYGPVDITNALIHGTMIKNSMSDPYPLYNIAFLKLDESAEKPDEYCGLRYQYDPYDGEGVLVIGYPNDLPEGEEARRGTYMYSGMGKVVSTFAFTNHNAATSDGYEGSPLYMNWGDGNGYVVIGMNAYNQDEGNMAIKINRPIFGAMRKLREESHGKAYCGGIDYKNINNHQMELKSDGYYECTICGYRAVAPELQDKDILTEKDYLKVLSTTLIYGVVAADSTYMNILYNLREAANEVRNSDSSYIGKYEYQDGKGECALVFPEQEYLIATMTPSLNNPVEVTSFNIAYYKGIWALIADYFLGIALASTNIALIALIDKTVHELEETGDPTISIYELIKKLAEKANNKALNILLDLIQFGVDVEEADRDRGIQVGDTIVTFTHYRYNESVNIMVIYDENKKLVGISLD